MKIVHPSARGPNFGLGTQILVSVLSSALLFAVWPQILLADQDAQAPQAPPHSEQTPDQLQQLVAPIALYPDSLVAQILAASAFPEQVVEADRWLQAHPDLKGDALGQAVDLEAVVVGTDDRMSSYPWSVELGIGEMSHAANDSKHRHMVLSDSS